MNRSNVNILGVCESRCGINCAFVSDRHMQFVYADGAKKETVSRVHSKQRHEEMHFGILSTIG